MRRAPPRLGLAALALLAGCVPAPATPPPAPFHVQARAEVPLPPPPPWRRPDSDMTRQLIQRAGLSYMEDGHSNTPLHIHAYIRVWYDGRRVEIPAHLGIVDGRMAYMHTHDSTGTVHMEGPLGLTFTLRQLFKLWNVPLRGARVYQDGKLVSQPKRLQLVDHTTLSIVFGRLPDGFGFTDEDEDPEP